MSSKLEYEVSTSDRPVLGIYIKKNQEYILQLSVTIVAISADGKTKLGGYSALLDPKKVKEIHEWLFEIGKQHLDKVNKFEKIIINADDVDNLNLNKDWDLLEREPISE
ncbi:hypothetical protein [Bacillus mojavensis]|uniref:hypothetical protein n=1 Tax=Bacillus mojavensis TaxID=72360 RepID=UPI002282464C|nr:hypothetical protein [Bacillus mojavensis]MCY8103404.1 hypothetical protein [Bacillus mojavensis]MCY8481428.1 hypothetical protein [Bacillus mojavensis]